MTRTLFDHPLDLLERRFQALQERAAGLPEVSRQELETALQELSQAIAGLRQGLEAGENPRPAPPSGREAQAGQGESHSPRDPAAQHGPCEAMLRHIFNAIPDLLTVHDRDFNTIMSNWHGYESVPEADRPGQPKCYRVYHHRDRPCEGCHAPEVLATGQPVKLEKVSPVDGRVREVSAYPIRDESGRVALVVEYVRDITERCLAEQALAESEERFRMLFEYAPDSYILADMQGEIIDCNKATEDLTGYSREELNGSNFARLPLLDTHQQARLADLLAQGVHGEVLEQVDFTLTRKDGGEVMVEGKSLPLNIKGRTLVLAIARDITARKQAEAALAAHLGFLQLLLDTIPNPIFFKDAQGAYLGCNKAFEDYLGVTREAIVGKTVYDLSPRELADDYHAMDLEAFQTRGTQVYESLVQTASGARRHVVFHKATFPNPDGSVGGLVGIIQDITDLKRAEEALRESEATLRTLIEANPETLFLLDTQGVILAASRVAAQRLGKSLEEIIGADAFALVPAQVGQERFAIFQQVVATGQPRRFEDVRGDFCLDISMNPIFDQDKVVQVAVLGVDITARKRAEEALRESEARFRAVFEFAPVGIAMIDLTGGYLQTNQALQQYLGYTAEELRGMNFKEVTHPEDLPENLRLRGELLGGQCQHYSLEKRYRRKDGDIVWARMMVALLRDVQREPQYSISTVIDITARKQAEAKLRESEQRFRFMAETIQDVFWIATPEIGKTLYVSPGYESIWGRTCEELYRDPKTFIEAIHPEDRERVGSEVLAGHTQGVSWSHDYRIIKPDGTVRWIHDRGFPIRDDQGRVILFTGVATDVTERKALEAQLLQAQKMEAVGRLAGGVAHDFNNLLMAITGYGELMRTKVLIGDPLYGHLENILKAADRAAALTQQLLTFSRRQIVHPQVVDLNRVVRDLEPMLRRLIGEDLDLEIIAESGPAAVKADPGHLGQIIMNLVVNGRDAMPIGGRLTLKTAPVDFTVRRHTRFEPVPPGAYVILEVQDTGVGMDDATQTHVFEPFFTTKEPGKGTGLGLSTVYGIVKQSGGYLDLASEPEAGSTFTIYLPRLEAIVEPPKAKIPITASFRGKETILLVEDEDVLRGLLAKFLQLYGYTVLEARHGGEALLTCERHPGPIHMMVTDVVMPQMSGRELADRLAPLRPDMKVLYMSGYTEDTLVQHGVADLSVPFLQKPFRPIDLARRVHAVLNPPVDS